MIRVEAVETTTASEELLRAIYAVEAASSPDRWEDADHALGYMRNPPASQRRLHWVAYDGDELAGMARLNLMDGLPWLHLAVAPEHRRRGAGRALLAVAREAVGDRSIGGHHSSADGAAFARAVGACDGQRDVRSALDLRAAVLPEPAVPPGYELRSWAGRAPDELVESYAAARNALDDAPHPDEDVRPAWDVAQQRELEEAVERRGREPRVTVALAGGEVVAFTEVRVAAPPARKASTEDTATLAGHRGRGLCRAVKSESLRLLRAERPDIETVTTLNAESNGAMRAVNTGLGFVPIATLTVAILAAP